MLEYIQKDEGLATYSLATHSDSDTGFAEVMHARNDDGFMQHHDKDSVAALDKTMRTHVHFIA